MDRYMGIDEVFQRLGVKFSLDWDGELQCEMPEYIDIDIVEQLIVEQGNNIVRGMKGKQRCAMRRLHGGPFDGKPYGNATPGWGWVQNVSRGQWAAYKILPDGRGYFVGIETNKKKAKKLANTASHTAWGLGR